MLAYFTEIISFNRKSKHSYLKIAQLQASFCQKVLESFPVDRLTTPSWIQDNKWDRAETGVKLPYRGLTNNRNEQQNGGKFGVL